MKAMKAMKAKNSDSVIGDVLVKRAADLPQSAVQPHLHIHPVLAKRAFTAGLAFLAEHDAEISKRYPGLELEELRSLPALCDRLGDAQHAVGGESPIHSKASRALFAAGLRWRRKLMPVAATLAANGKLDQDALAEVRAGNGTADNLRDVIDLVELLQPHNALVELACGHSALAEATTAARAALDAMGSQTTSTAERRRAIDVRDRIATVVLMGHDRMRVAVALMSSIRHAINLVGPLSRRGTRRIKVLSPVEPVVNPS